MLLSLLNKHKPARFVLIMGKLKDCVGEGWLSGMNRRKKSKTKQTLHQQKKIYVNQICCDLCAKSNPNGGEKMVFVKFRVSQASHQTRMLICLNCYSQTRLKLQSPFCPYFDSLYFVTFDFSCIFLLSLLFSNNLD